MSLEKAFCCALALSCVAAPVGFGAVEFVDFTDGMDVGASAWDLSETEDDAKGRKFPDGGESITSPVYGGAAVSVSVSAQMVGSEIAGSGSSLNVEARNPTGGSWMAIGGIEFAGGTVTNETFALSRSDGFRQFRISFTKGKGTMRVRSFTVKWLADGEVAAPHSLFAAEVGAGSFRAGWSIDEPVDAFLLDCWSVSMAPWTGTAEWMETFSHCTNATKSAKKLTADIIDGYTDNAGWSGEYVYAPLESEGIIQVNKSSDSVGWLVSPELPTLSSVELVVSAKAFAQQPDHVMPVYLIRGSDTNELASFGLSTSFADCHCRIGDVVAGDRIAFKSFSVGSKRRVAIDSVVLVSGFAPGVPVTNSVCDGATAEYSESPGFTVEGLEPGSEYFFSVRAVSGGNVSEPSEICAVVTGSADLPQSVIDAVAVSELARKGGVRKWTEDFGSLADVFPGDGNTVSWLNGVTLGHWQAYCGGEALTEIARNNGASKVSGLYAYWATNCLADTYALGAMTSGEAKDYVFGLAFFNDTDMPVRKVVVKYDGVQFGFRNPSVQELAFEYLVTDRLFPVSAQNGWTQCDALTYKTARDSSSGLVNGMDFHVTGTFEAELPELTIPKAAYLLVRWRRSAVTNAAAVGIDNVAIGFEVQARPMIIVVR